MQFVRHVVANYCEKACKDRDWLILEFVSPRFYRFDQEEKRLVEVVEWRGWRPA